MMNGEWIMVNNYGLHRSAMLLFEKLEENIVRAKE